MQNDLARYEPYGGTSQEDIGAFPVARERLLANGSQWVSTTVGGGWFKV